MDTVNTCARFLILRLKLERTEDQMIRELCELFNYPESKARTRDLIKRFKRNARLMSILCSWVMGESTKKLEDEDIVALFDLTSLDAFSRKIDSETTETIRALTEVLPVIVKRTMETNYSLDAQL